MLAITPMRGRSWARWGAVWAAASVVPRLRAGDRILCATWEMAPHLVGRAPLAVAWHGSDITRPARRGGRERVIARAVNLPVSRYLGGLLGAPHTVLPVPLDPLAPPAVEPGCHDPRTGLIADVDAWLQLLDPTHPIRRHPERYGQMLGIWLRERGITSRPTTAAQH